ncbi:AlpA family phage regulatory protein [Trinickia sp. NRRL B-1857]|uniref:helix-turn-helix transcriptional regulator n=1 Tax=Trinickia sp. NRRL B-1857 TaxID=3162879 RepID=UPI003D2AC2CE
MIAHIDLPLDDPIDCWLLVREIARAAVPDLNPRAAGMECIVAKKPLALGVVGIGDLQFVERGLTDDDRAYLLRVLPGLPALQIPYSGDVAEVFLQAFRALPDRPAWEPVLLDESRYLREHDRIITERWTVASEHLRVLQNWLDTGRIRAFRGKHLPASEMLVGTLIPRRDVLVYLNYWDIAYSAKEPVEASTVYEAVPTKGVAASEMETPADVTVADAKPASRSTRTARRVPAQSEVVEEVPVEQAVTPAQAIPAGPLLSIKDVSERTGIRESMLHERMRSGSKYYDPTFPRKIKLGEKTVRYSEAELNAWLQARLSATSGKSLSASLGAA